MRENDRERRFSRRGPRKPVPVEEGKEYEVIVEGIGSKGDGIARYQGFVVVVPGVELGDKIKVKIDAVRGKVSFGSVVEKLGKASPEEMPQTEAAEGEPAAEPEGEEEPKEEAEEEPAAGEESSEETAGEEAEEEETEGEEAKKEEEEKE
jgi:predicted RNA-binding protein with TRAM domain